MFTFVVILSVLLCVSNAYPAVTAPSRYMNYENNQYYFDPNFKDNYLAAVKLCQQKQMELLAIESQGELEAVTKFVKSLATDNKTCFWTSDSKLSSDKDFIVLSTGEKVSVLNWGSGEPNTNIKYYAVCKSKGGIVH